MISSVQKNKEVVQKLYNQPLNKRNMRLHVIFIDQFIVPEKAKQEFIERMNINRSFIKKLSGFIEDAAYERPDGYGNLIYITIAVWKNERALKKAKEAVQAEYKKQDFKPEEMLERLNITMDRGIYKAVMSQP